MLTQLAHQHFPSLAIDVCLGSQGVSGPALLWQALHKRCPRSLNSSANSGLKLTFPTSHSTGGPTAISQQPCHGPRDHPPAQNFLQSHTHLEAGASLWRVKKLPDCQTNPVICIRLLMGGSTSGRRSVNIEP